VKQGMRALGSLGGSRGRWAAGALVLAAALPAAAWMGRPPEVVPLRVAEKALVEADPSERLYSIRFADPRGNPIDAYLREPVAALAEAERSGERLPGVVLVAGRFTGREAVKMIPGPLENVMLAVEYPQTIPVRVSVREWVSALPSIRRSARRMPGVLSGAARYLAERPDIDASRIGLVGVSFGVPFAAAAGKDRIFNVVALHYGGSTLSSLFDANLPVENPWIRAGVAGFAGWWFREMDPGRHIGDISPTPILLINATRDDLIPRAAAERLASRARPPVRQIWLPYGHLGVGDTEVIREVADSTFRHFGELWRNGAAPLEVGCC
jgi:fermentation-respiration switch protein FrsA (DUF1100 family)